MLLAHGSIELNEQNSHSLTWIFASNNEITCHEFDAYTGNQIWCQNISNFKENFDYGYFQNTKAELNKITFRRYMLVFVLTYLWILCSTSAFLWYFLRYRKYFRVFYL